LSLEDSKHVRGDVLIGADGVHSRIRDLLFGDARASFTGFMAWRAVIPMARLSARLRNQEFVVCVGPSGHIITYPMHRGEFMNFFGAIERGDWLSESWSEAGTAEECRHDFALWHEDMLEIIGAIDIPYKWALLGREPLRQWSVGRISLLGDACHPTLPFLGQGANMAIEDGMVLARCLEAYDDVPTALRRYESLRLDRTSRVVSSSLESGQRNNSAHLVDPVQARAFMDREYAPRALGARFDWLYQYDSMSIPV
jgi:salicylate hydroxylase